MYKTKKKQKKGGGLLANVLGRGIKTIHALFTMFSR